jgi:hypothetical protein
MINSHSFVKGLMGSSLQPKELLMKFFDEFAKSKKVNPLDADNWYSFTNTAKREIVQNVCFFFTFVHLLISL